MSANAVQIYVADQLNGLPIPSEVMGPAQAWVLPPPVVQLAPNPQLYVWGARIDENRYTLPRFRGQKRVGYTIRVWAQWASDNDPALLQEFPVLLDAVRDYLRSVPIPADLVDPRTGATSVLLNLGERIVLDYGTPIGTEDQRSLLHVAAFSLPVAEILNPA